MPPPAFTRCPGPPFLRRVLVTFLLFGGAFAAALHAAPEDDLESCRAAFRSGDYEGCIKQARAMQEQLEFQFIWRELAIRSELALGRYDEAKAALLEAQANSSFLSSPRFHFLAQEIFRLTGDAADRKKVIDGSYGSRWTNSWIIRDADDLVAYGRLMLLRGADPKEVLDTLYGRALQVNEECREAWLATGQLALDKNDFALASKKFQQGLKLHENDPELLFGLARAFQESDGERTLALINQVLEINPKHAGALLTVAERQFDSERYGACAETVARVLAFNPKHPVAWALRSALDYMGNDHEAMRASRAKALSFSPGNPEIDYHIGRRLSRKYRFKESVEHQYQALAYDPDFLPAKIQIAQDLLRLGREAEALPLIEEIHAQDGYEVSIFNLVSLYDQIKGFTTHRTENFILRMPAKEAPVLADAVLAELRECKRVLHRKYGLVLDRPVVVEFFNDPQDFAVRTFGVPGVAGFLGACFGPVITMNSPGSLGARNNNWKAVLWHEYCHTVTLSATDNKMPRWFSEGISVYEELQRNEAWGQRMTPEYRRMILEEDALFKLGTFADAFLQPESQKHLLFAYWQAALTIEYLDKTYGFEALQGIMRDLRAGEPVNTALENNTTDLAELEAAFDAFARKQAEDFAAGLDWSAADENLARADEEALRAFLKEKPGHYAGLVNLADLLLKQERWEDAVKPLQQLVDGCPACARDGAAHEMLARAYRALGETEKEEAVLKTLAEHSASATEAFQRLIDLALEREDWKAVRENAERLLGVNPFLAGPGQAYARAGDALGKREEAVAAYRRLIAVGPEDPVDARYRLALLLKDEDPAEARIHLLEALSEAPRFRAGHRLLRELAKAGTLEPES